MEPRIPQVLRDPRRRNRLVTGLSCIFVFLLPVTGWNPILILWLVNLSFLRRETPQGGMRTVYGVMAALAAGLIGLNLAALLLLR